MVALRLVAGVILASVFLSIFGAFLVIHERRSSELGFKRDVEKLAGILNSLAEQSPGTQLLFELEVPSGCELRFENLQLVALIGGENLTFNLRVPVMGPTLKNQRAKLILRRVKEGIEVGEL